jgi:peptidoglycan/LPS O-acetylase OafA/YrhL
LTSLRFFAALFVMAYHVLPWQALADSSNQLERWIGSGIGQGYSGVAFFFVLSGFVLVQGYAGTLARFNLSAGFRFLVARVGRIWPLHVLTFGASIPLVLWIDNNHPVHGAARIVGAVCNIFLLQSIVPFSGIETDFNGPAWSLSAEAFFYLMFPLAIWLLASVFKPRAGTLVVLACGISLLEMANGLAHSNTVDAIALDGSPFLRLPDFVVGVCLGLAFLRRRAHGATQSRTRASAVGWTVAELAAPTGAFALAATAAHLPIGLVRGGMWVVPSASIVWIYSHQRGIVSRLLQHRVLVTLGEISFGVYMWHFLVFHYGVSAHPQMSAWSFAGLVTVVTLGLSYLTWNRFELPARRRIVEAGDRFATRRIDPPAAEPPQQLHQAAA